ncbi:MAG: manganese efflux pump MntP family protein [Acidimicrobiia bacterium]
MKEASIIAILFGSFQGLMPVIGWSIGNILKDFIELYSSWIAFTLLVSVGIKIAYDSFKKESISKSITFLTLISLSIATSVDALIVGTTLVALKLSLLSSAVVIGFTTLFLSIFGYYLGKKLGSLFAKRIELVGGIVLILLGIKYLIN